MKTYLHKKAVWAALLGGALASTLGCADCWCWPKKPPRTPPLGVQSDEIWRKQEASASASDFVIYQHEFDLNGLRLNMGGEDHLKSIAVRLRAGACVPVVIERSMTSVDPQSQYKYPVNPNSELDMQRRDVVIRLLTTLGVQNAEQSVVVAPAFAEGYTATEAMRSYNRGMTPSNVRHRGVGEPMAGNGGALDTGIVTLP